MKANRQMRKNKGTVIQAPFWHIDELSHENVEENKQVKNWIILDSGSTLNLFSNPNMVKNIKIVDE